MRHTSLPRKRASIDGPHPARGWYGSPRHRQLYPIQRPSPEVRAALGRIRAGITDPADLEILRRAVAAGQVQIVSGDRAVTVGGNANDVVIVTGDGNTIITGAAASALSTAVEYDRLTHRYLASVADRWAWLTLEDTGPRVPLTDVYVMLEALPVTSPKPLGESPDLPAERQERLEHAGLMVSEGSSCPATAPGAIRPDRSQWRWQRR